MRRLKKYILGPCSLESYDVCKEVLDVIYKFGFNHDLYFKGSYDKANRTSIKSDRGPGLISSLDIFNDIRSNYPGIRITTDVHEVSHVKVLKDHVDMIQIPAFLCRQTDLIVESAKYFNKINIKKGQWMSPESMEYIVKKIRAVNKDCEVFITERGTSFGYGNLLVDFSAVNIMKDFCDGVILDCTHSTQKANGNVTSGDRELAKKYAMAAKIFEYDGVFIETHPNLLYAISDRDSQIELSWVKNNLYKL